MIKSFRYDPELQYRFVLHGHLAASPSPGRRRRTGSDTELTSRRDHVRGASRAQRRLRRPRFRLTASRRYICRRAGACRSERLAADAPGPPPTAAARRRARAT